VDPWAVLDTIKDATEDIPTWLPNNSKNSEFTTKNASLTETMINNARPLVFLVPKSGESPTMDMLEKDTTEAPMNKL